MNKDATRRLIEAMLGARNGQYENAARRRRQDAPPPQDIRRPTGPKPRIGPKGLHGFKADLTWRF